MAFTSITKKVSLINELSGSETIKEKVVMLDDKVQQMLLWSNMSTIWSYLLLSGIIVRIYKGFGGTHAIYLIGTLTTICLLMAIFIFFVWKSIAYKELTKRKASKAYLNYQIGKLVGQRKLVTACLITNILLLAVSSVFFCVDVNNGITTLFKMAAPMSIITYCLGLYFIVKFTKQKHKLDDLNKQVDHILFMERVSRN